MMQATATTVHTDKLQATITKIDGLSKGGCNTIEALARLGLVQLQRPDAYRHLHDVAAALDAILNECGVVQMDIELAADEVGCAWVKPAESDMPAAPVGGLVN